MTRREFNNIVFLLLSAVYSLFFLIACFYSPRTGDTLVYINMFDRIYWDSFHNQPVFSILRNLIVTIVDDPVVGITIISYFFLFLWVFILAYKFRSFSVFIILALLMVVIPIFGYEMYWFLLRQNISALILATFILAGFPRLGVLLSGTIHFGVGLVGVVALLMFCLYKRKGRAAFLYGLVIFLLMNIFFIDLVMSLNFWFFEDYYSFYSNYAVGVQTYFRVLFFDLFALLFYFMLSKKGDSLPVKFTAIMLLSCVTVGLLLLNITEMGAYRIFSIGKVFGIVLFCFSVSSISKRLLRF